MPRSLHRSQKQSPPPTHPPFLHRSNENLSNQPPPFTQLQFRPRSQKQSPPPTHPLFLYRSNENLPNQPPTLIRFLHRSKKRSPPPPTQLRFLHRSNENLSHQLPHLTHLRSLHQSNERDYHQPPQPPLTPQLLDTDMKCLLPHTQLMHTTTHPKQTTPSPSLQRNHFRSQLPSPPPDTATASQLPMKTAPSPPQKNQPRHPHRATTTPPHLQGNQSTCLCLTPQLTATVPLLPLLS